MYLCSMENHKVNTMYKYTSMSQFNHVNQNYLINGREQKKGFQKHVNASLRFFVGEGDRQIAILQKLCNAAMAGLTNNDVTKLVGYMQAAIPQHEIKMKRKGRTLQSVEVMPKKDKSVRYRPAKTNKFIDNNPVWHEWGKQASEAETPDFVGVFRAAAMLRKALEKGGYNGLEGDAEQIKSLILMA